MAAWVNRIKVRALRSKVTVSAVIVYSPCLLPCLPKYIYYTILTYLPGLYPPPSFLLTCEPASSPFLRSPSGSSFNRIYQALPFFPFCISSFSPFSDCVPLYLGYLSKHLFLIQFHATYKCNPLPPYLVSLRISFRRPVSIPHNLWKLILEWKVVFVCGAKWKS